MIVADNRQRMVGPILMSSAALLGILAVLFWAGIMPVDERVRGMIALAFGIAALGDALIGLIIVTRSDES
jgi:hypothetical protein